MCVPTNNILSLAMIERGRFSRWSNFVHNASSTRLDKIRGVRFVRTGSTRGGYSACHFGCSIRNVSSSRVLRKAIIIWRGNTSSPRCYNICSPLSTDAECKNDRSFRYIGAGRCLFYISYFVNDLKIEHSRLRFVVEISGIP